MMEQRPASRLTRRTFQRAPVCFRRRPIRFLQAPSIWPLPIERPSARRAAFRKTSGLPQDEQPGAYVSRGEHFFDAIQFPSAPISKGPFCDSCHYRILLRYWKITEELESVEATKMLPSAHIRSSAARQSSSNASARAGLRYLRQLLCRLRQPRKSAIPVTANCGRGTRKKRRAWSHSELETASWI